MKCKQHARISVAWNTVYKISFTLHFKHTFQTLVVEKWRGNKDVGEQL